MPKASNVCIALALLAGCGGAAVPHERVTAAQSAVRAAEVGGAQGVPQATLHLKRAKEHVLAAQALIKDGDNEKADALLQRAEVDADLALALSREAAAKNEAQQAAEQVKALKQKKIE